MLRLVYIVTTFCLVLTNGALANQPTSFADMIEKASPAVVNISTTQKMDRSNNLGIGDLPDNPLDLFEFFEKELGKKRSKKAHSLGSGFIVDPSGYIVTNHHVIAEAEQIDVTIGDVENQQTYKAKIVGKDPRTDLALLKIDVKQELPYIKFGDSDKARVGDWVVVIGNPFGLSGTATSGIISAKARYLNSSQFDDLIQTDASINKGNSGGPMFNMEGEVIGVSTIILSTSGGNMGIGFAIPSSIVKPIIEQLKVHGSITRGWLGVKIQHMDSKMANALKLPGTKGALVAEVTKGSPADKSGIIVGDIITSFDGKAVTNMNKLPKMVADYPINKKANVGLIRNGKAMTLSVLIEKPVGDPFGENSNNNDQSNQEANFLLGLKVANINNRLESKYRIPKGTKGVVIIGVENGSIFEELGVTSGDVIKQINQANITNVEEFEKTIKQFEKSPDKTAVFLFSRRGENRYMVVELG
jgi:serine protease Do